MKDGDKMYLRKIKDTLRELSKDVYRALSMINTLFTRVSSLESRTRIFEEKYSNLDKRLSALEGLEAYRNPKKNRKW